MPTSASLREYLKAANAPEATLCLHPACGSYSYGSYCSDHVDKVTAEESAIAKLRGIGVVSPPVNVAHTNAANRRVRRTRRNEGYIAANGAWRPIEPAPYYETLRDVGGKRRERKQRDKQHKRILASVKSDIALQAEMGTIHQPE